MKTHSIWRRRSTSMLIGLLCAGAATASVATARTTALAEQRRLIGEVQLLNDALAALTQRELALQTQLAGLAGLRSSVAFRTGEARLEVVARRDVESIGRSLANFPNLQIIVSGYADARGVGEMNLGLSEQRAQAVKAALVGSGVDPERVSIEANGEWFSQANAGNADDQALQRRVDIRVERH